VSDERTIYSALQGGARERGALPLFRLVATALRLVRRAAPRELRVVLLAQAMAAVALAAQLLVGASAARYLLGPPPLEPDRVAGYVVALVVALVVQHISQAFVTEGQRLLAELTARHASSSILDATGSADLLAFESAEFHDLMQRAQVAALSRPVALTTNLMQMVTGVAAGIGIAVAVVAVQPLLLLLLVATYVPLWVMLARNTHSLYRFSFGATPADRQRMYLAGVLTGREEAKEVRSFALVRFVRSRFDALYDRRLTEFRDLSRQRRRRAMLGGLATAVLTAGVFALLAGLYVAGTLEAADALVVAVAVQQLGGRMAVISANGAALYESALFLDDFARFTALGHGPPTIVDVSETPSGTITFDHVSFRYPGGTTAALDAVSLAIDEGETVAIVGLNGSGKTTLAKLLCGLLVPTEGTVSWGSVRSSSRSPSWGERSAVIFQDFVRYFLTVAENIGVGDTTRMSDAAGIREAARQAGAAGFIERLPDGYDTLLGPEFEGGAELSGGQWQRVALARALFRDAPLLVLDEPAAALDVPAEFELYELIRTMHGRRTVVLVTHRLASTRHADRIVVLDDGRVVETGTHDQLVKETGLYAHLYTLQSQWLAAPEADDARVSGGAQPHDRSPARRAAQPAPGRTMGR